MEDLWQQNKRWILGVVAGLLLFWIATSIVRSIYDGESAETRVTKLAREVQKQELYDRDTLNAARKAAEALEIDAQRLRSQLEFQAEERFSLAGKGDPDLHFDEVQRDVRSLLVDKAQQFAVEMGGDNLEWDPPVGQEEIQRTLYGLCVLEHAVGRLLDAGAEVRDAQPDRIGLQAIERFEVSSRSSNKNSRRRTSRRRDRTKTVDVSERIAEFAVDFKFRADAPTVQLFLEKCRAGSPALLLDEGFKVKGGRNRGDALTVTGKVIGLSVRDA